MKRRLNINLRPAVAILLSILFLLAFYLESQANDDYKANKESKYRGLKSRVMSQKDYEKFKNKQNRKEYSKRRNRSQKTCVRTIPKLEVPVLDDRYERYR